MTIKCDICSKRRSTEFVSVMIQVRRYNIRKNAPPYKRGQPKPELRCRCLCADCWLLLNGFLARLSKD